MIDSINLQIASELLPQNYKHDFKHLFTDFEKGRTNTEKHL
jgi:hypothetical protein